MERRARWDHCPCKECDGTGKIEVAEVIFRDNQRYATRNSYLCAECDGDGFKGCIHVDDEEPYSDVSE